VIKHVELQNEEGKTLRGYLHLPSDCNGKLVIMFHGFTGNKTEHGGHFRDFSRLLERNQIASLRLDFSGNGESDGNFNEFTFDTLISEANLIINYGKALEGIKEIILLGYSMGGAIAAYVSARRTDISKLVLWAPARNITEIIKTRYENARKLPNGDADSGNYPISLAMYESLNKYDVLAGIEKFEKPVLIIHGKLDLAVNYQFSYEYLERFKHASLHIIDTAGHGFDLREEKNKLLNMSYEFVRG
jgi:pimeloyl-ACP methyl ester carboxylesterase